MMNLIHFFSLLLLSFTAIGIEFSEPSQKEVQEELYRLSVAPLSDETKLTFSVPEHFCYLGVNIELKSNDKPDFIADDFHQELALYPKKMGPLLGLASFALYKYTQIIEALERDGEAQEGFFTSFNPQLSLERLEENLSAFESWLRDIDMPNEAIEDLYGASFKNWWIALDIDQVCSLKLEFDNAHEGAQEAHKHLFYINKIADSVITQTLAKITWWRIKQYFIKNPNLVIDLTNATGFDFASIVQIKNAVEATYKSAFANVTHGQGTCGFFASLSCHFAQNLGKASSPEPPRVETFPIFFGTPFFANAQAKHASKILTRIYGRCPQPGTLPADLARYTNSTLVKKENFDDVLDEIEAQLQRRFPVILFEGKRGGHWVTALAIDRGKEFVVLLNNASIEIVTFEKLKQVLAIDNATRYMRDLSQAQMATLIGGSPFWALASIADWAYPNSYSTTALLALSEILSVDAAENKVGTFTLLIFPEQEVITRHN